MAIQLNFNTSNEYELIEYPGLVKNNDNMITTLGGLTKVSQVRRKSCLRKEKFSLFLQQVLGGESKRLELRFHPENPFNKPLCGDVNSRAGLLLSIKVRRSKRNPTKPPQFVVKILGYTTKSFTFECKSSYSNCHYLRLELT